MAHSGPHSYNTNNNNNNNTITTTSHNAPSTRSSLRSVFTVSPPDTPSPPSPPFRPSLPEPGSQQYPELPRHPAPHGSRKWNSWQDYLVEISKEPAVGVGAQGGRGTGGDEEDEPEGGGRHVSCPDTVAYRAFVPGAEQENAQTDDEGEGVYNSEAKGPMRRATATTVTVSKAYDKARYDTVLRFHKTLVDLLSLQNRLVAFLSPSGTTTSIPTTTTTSRSRSRIIADRPLHPLRPLLQTFALASHNAGRREAFNEVYTHLLARADPTTATSTSHSSASKMMLGAAERAILRREAQFVNRLAARTDGMSKKMDGKKGKEGEGTREGEDEDKEKNDMKEVEEWVGGLEEVLRDVLVVLERAMERAALGLHY